MYRYTATNVCVPKTVVEGTKDVERERRRKREPDESLRTQLQDLGKNKGVLRGHTQREIVSPPHVGIGSQRYVWMARSNEERSIS